MPVRTRGKANTQAVVRITPDPAALAAAVDSAVDAQVIEISLFTAPLFDRRAVIDADVGVVRAFIPTPWRWQPVTLNHVLILATLRG